MKYGCSSKSTPAASNLLNQLWGCFLANSCLDTNTSLATAWPAAIYVHLMLTGAAGLSCWWNTVILFLITVCSMWDSPGLRTTIGDLHVCVHSAANKENGPTPWKHLSNTLNRNLSTQTKDFFLITLQMSSDGCKHKSLTKMKIAQTCARACMHNFIWDHKNRNQVLLPWRQCLLTCFYTHTSCSHASTDKHITQGIPRNQCPKQNLLRWMDVYFAPVSMDILIHTSSSEKVMSCWKETSWNLVLSGYFFIHQTTRYTS